MIDIIRRFVCYCKQNNRSSAEQYIRSFIARNSISKMSLLRRFLSSYNPLCTISVKVKRKLWEQKVALEVIKTINYHDSHRMRLVKLISSSVDVPHVREMIER